MDMTDRKLLNLVQSSLPMVNRPYLKLGKELGIGEQEVMDRLANLKRRFVYVALMRQLPRESELPTAETPVYVPYSFMMTLGYMSVYFVLGGGSSWLY